jgi:hypothetical protein
MGRMVGLVMISILLSVVATLLANRLSATVRGHLQHEAG